MWYFSISDVTCWMLYQVLCCINTCVVLVQYKGWYKILLSLEVLVSLARVCTCVYNVHHDDVSMYGASDMGSMSVCSMVRSASPTL